MTLHQMSASEAADYDDALNLCALSVLASSQGTLEDYSSLLAFALGRCMALRGGVSDDGSRFKPDIASDVLTQVFSAACRIIAQAARELPDDIAHKIERDLSAIAVRMRVLVEQQFS